MKGLKISAQRHCPWIHRYSFVKGMNQDALKAMLQDVHIDRMIEPRKITRLIRFILENDGIDGTCIKDAVV